MWQNALVESFVETLKNKKCTLTEVSAKVGVLEDFADALSICQVFFYFQGSRTINQVAVVDLFLSKFLNFRSDCIGCFVDFLLFLNELFKSFLFVFIRQLSKLQFFLNYLCLISTIRFVLLFFKS